MNSTLRQRSAAGHLYSQGRVLAMFIEDSHRRLRARSAASHTRTQPVRTSALSRSVPERVLEIVSRPPRHPQETAEPQKERPEESRRWRNRGVSRHRRLGAPWKLPAQHELARAREDGAQFDGPQASAASGGRCSALQADCRSGARLWPFLGLPSSEFSFWPVSSVMRPRRALSAYVADDGMLCACFALRARCP